MADSVHQPDQPARAASPAEGIFVGRQREMAELTAALEDALSGHGRLVMLVGEPGIGKTRTAQELAALAEQRGAQVLWGRCYEGEGAPPYWPWVQPMRGYVQRTDAQRLRSEMGPGAADIAEVVAEVRQKLPDLEVPRSLEPDQARFRLFDSITTFLKNAAQRYPLMLVLDDLHWADKPSLLLLEFLARELSGSRLFVVGTCRDSELSPHQPLSETLAQLSREPVFQREQLVGLNLEDTGRFIEAAGGAKPPPATVEALYSHTEGNPFFLAELVRFLKERPDGTWEEVGGPRGIGVPAGVREVIAQRLNRLSEECSQTLVIASVIGRDFDFKLLSMLRSEVSEEQLLTVVDEALEAHLIEELARGLERYQFSHVLIQQTLAEGLSTGRRIRLHARIGEALEQLYGTDAEVHAAELAHHFAQAEAVIGPDKLVRYSLLAGERALASHAYENAQAHFERGLAARDITLSGTEAASDEEAAALLFGLARAQSATLAGHPFVDAFAILSRAFEYYTESGNIALAVAAAEFPIAPPAFLIPGVAELMARALTLVPANSHEAGRLLSRYGGILGYDECDYEGAQQALGRAITIARRERDVSLEAQTLTYGAVVSAQHIHWQDSVDNGLRAVELATGDETPLTERVSRWWTAVSLLHMGDLNAARTHVLVLRELSEKRSTPRTYAGNGLTPITYASCLQGDWTAGREYSDRGLAMASLDNPVLLLPRILLEYQTGEFVQGEV